MSPEYQDWKNSIFIRDNYTCQECGKKEKLQVHHVKSFAYYPELRFDISNGITLCIDCHRQTQDYFKYLGQNPLEFIKEDSLTKVGG